MCIQIAGICQTILCSPAVTDSFGPLLPPPIFCQNEYEHSAAHQGVYYACAREKERVYVVTLKQQPLFFLYTHTNTWVKAVISGVAWLHGLPPILQPASMLGTTLPSDSVRLPGYDTPHMETVYHRWETRAKGHKDRQRHKETNTFHTS